MAQRLLLNFNTTDVHRRIGQLKARFPRACVRATNRATTSARAGLASDTAKELKRAVSVVRDQLSIQEATEATPTARIYSAIKRLPLYDLLPRRTDPRGPYPSRGRGTGVPVRGSTVPGSFIARVGRGGHWGIFKRVAKDRLPIRELHGPSVWKVALNHLPAAEKRGLDALRKNLVSELRFALSQGSSA